VTEQLHDVDDIRATSGHHEEGYPYRDVVQSGKNLPTYRRDTYDHVIVSCDVSARL